MTNEENPKATFTIKKIANWHYARNLINGSNDQAQVKKLIEEVSELVDSLSTGQSPIDDIGDIIVVLVNIAERHKLTIDECLEHAYQDIKDRRGQMVDGIFVKEE